jgi:hypothetical protein
MRLILFGKLRPPQRRHPFGDIAPWIVAAYVRDQFIDELLSKGRKEAATVPGGQHPAADWHAAIGHRNRLYAIARNADVGRNDRRA